MSRYDEINIGDKAEIIQKITDSDIDKFVSLTGDDNKLHINKEYASKTSFKQPVAHGMLSASFISTIIGTKIPGDGALWFSQSLDFLLPVRSGDTIHVIAEVIGKDDRLRAIELRTDIYNQDKQKVIGGKAKVKVIEEEVKKQETTAESDSHPKCALIIGATGGIGSSVCMQLANSGYAIAVHYYSNEQKAAGIVNAILETGHNAVALQGSIDTKAAVDALVEKAERRIGEISVIVNCATIKIPNIKFENLEWPDIEKHLNINLRANFFLVQRVLPGMKNRKYGRIIFVTTQYTEGTPPPELMPYVAAKYSLNGFAKALAVELAAHNITVNLVSPGMTETDLLAGIPEKARLLAAAKSPVKRLAQPEDVSSAIAFLASEKSGYITGETIRVNGGQIMM
ncbi:SDR family oxidoreductase [Sediminibacterium roseum]|uniref:SDR family oxidoreductase n=1 Tax=Sediminibacterium roseum TaxID=1978412 RepID=A0ABW9ZPR0_9BACT|nr:SDR family oxidoreductase [Sediminibacterium roseum]NCI49075.1 SDR family oxidoreductase [Sediminibacterium roseum]